MDVPAVEDEGQRKRRDIRRKFPFGVEPAEGHAGGVGAAELLQRSDIDAENIPEQADQRRPAGGVAEIVLPEGQARAVEALRHQTPVEPKPPAPRTVSLASVISATRAWVTGAITIWAMRMPREMTKGSSPRLASSTFTSPR